MKFALCLFNYFPYGGLQRDFIKIAEECLYRQHTVQVFTSEWRGEKIANLPVTLVPASGWTNHGRLNTFIQKLATLLNEEKFDAIVGFNKIPGLDIYYAADTCYAARMATRHFLTRWSPRYRSYSRNEAAVFSQNVSTQLLMISPTEQAHFIHHYQTATERFHLLPPSITVDRMLPVHTHTGMRMKLRKEWGLSEQHRVILMVASRFKTKGLDRTLQAMASLPAALLDKTILLVVGDDKAAPFFSLIKRLKLQSRVKFLGARNDVPSIMVASDLLLNPAYVENTGTVLIEAMANGLPVLASGVCGYKDHVVKAKAGLIVPEPFDKNVFVKLLTSMISEESKSLLYPLWRDNAIRYCQHLDLFNGAKKAVNIIEDCTREKI